MKNWLDKFQKGGFIDPEIIEARKKAYRTIKPSSYDDLNNVARWYSNTTREDYDEPRSEDAWAFYLKQKEKSDYLTPSKYKPSISKDPNAKYYNVDPELEQAIFNSFKDKVSLNKIMPVDEFDLNVRYTEEELTGIPHTNVGLKDRNATGSKARMLGRFSVSKGHDEKGDYLSYYDTYDFPKIIQNRVKGEPFNIYGRVYYPNNKKQDGGIITDPMGQWKYPGQITRIPSSNITMQGVNYPVYGVGSNGQEQMMYPGQEYNFPGADYVDEYPMMKDGGLLSKSVTCSNCGWSWKGVEGGLDALTCHKCGGMIKMQNGGLWNKNKTQWVDSVNNANMMKNFVQREYLKNGPSIQVPGEPGRSTHLMAYDPLSKRVYPEVVNINGKLKYLPGDQAYDYADSTGEFITFPTAEQAAWYSNNGYKTGTGVTIGKKESGGQHGGLDRWFAEKWVDVKTGKECGRQEGENREGYPACRPSKRINADTPKTVSELSAAEKTKFKQEKTSSERINYNHKKQMGGDTPYNTMENFYEMKEGGNVPTNPSLWSKAKSVAKSKYDVYPSAYANGFAAKWYKERGGNWKKAEYGMEVMKNGGTNNSGFEALPKFVQAKILSNMGYGGYYNPMMANGGEPDGEMALGQIDAAINKLTNLRKFIQPDSDLEPWVSSKLTMVDDYANSVSDYIMYNPETQEMMELPLEEMKNGGIPERYKKMGFTKVGTKKQSTRPGKKWMVLAKKGDDYKVVHGGYKGMQDFKQHHSEQRRKNFWNRMGGKNSSKATDPFSPLYWHKRFGTWENGGQINQMQNGGIMMRDLQYPVYGMDRDLFNSRLQNGGNVNWLDNIN